MNNKKLINYLIKKGVKPHIKGFKYIYEAIEMLKLNDEFKLTKYVYPKIAEKYNTTWSRVERAIRNAIKTSKGDFKDKIPKEFFILTIIELM